MYLSFEIQSLLATKCLINSYKLIHEQQLCYCGRSVIISEHNFALIKHTQKAQADLFHPIAAVAPSNYLEKNSGSLYFANCPNIKRKFKR